MVIGTVRPEEAKVFDSKQGYHQFLTHDDEPVAYGSFEVFWSDNYPDDDNLEVDAAGWYWWCCSPGCLPDSGSAVGPFASSRQAYDDAQEY